MNQRKKNFHALASQSRFNFLDLLVIMLVWRKVDVFSMRGKMGSEKSTKG